MEWKKRLDDEIATLYRMHDLHNNPAQDKLKRICRDELSAHPEIARNLETQWQWTFFVTQMALEHVELPERDF